MSPRESETMMLALTRNADLMVDSGHRVRQMKLETKVC